MEGYKGMEGWRGGGGEEQTHCSWGGERGIVNKTDSLCGRIGWGEGERDTKGQRKVKPGIFFEKKKQFCSWR